MDMRERVDNGARFLDREVPDWADRLDLEHLRLSDCESCVLGQLYAGLADEDNEDGYSDGYTAGTAELNLPEQTDVEPEPGDRTAQALGFNVVRPYVAKPEEWSELQGHWMREIIARRSMGA